MYLGKLLLTCAGAGALTLAATAATGSNQWNKQFQIAGKADLRVELDDGRVEVRGGDASRIEARLLLNGYRLEPGGVQVIDHQTGDAVQIEVRVPHEMHWFQIGDHSIRLELRVPNGLTATIHTHDGSIVAENLNGTLRLRSGDGHIETTHVDGSLDAESGDGSIRVRGRLDSLRLRTGDGSIEAELSPGSKVATGWDLSTGDGHVTLTVPGDIGAELDAHTNDGSVQLDFPITTKTSSTHDVRGRIGAGGGTLRIRTGDGSIKILKR
jgi:hypothetical protein